MTQKLIEQDIFILIGLFTSTKMELPSIIKWIFWVRLKNQNLITLVKLKLIKIVYIFFHGKKASKLLDTSIFYKTHLEYYCWISEYNVPFDSIE